MSQENVEIVKSLSEVWQRDGVGVRTGADGPDH